MDWSKMKTKLIVLFLALNLFLAGSLMVSEYNKTVLSEQLLSDTQQILQSHGTSLRDGLLAGRQKEKIRGYFVEVSTQIGRSAADRLLGSDAQVQSDDGAQQYTLDGNSLVVSGVNELSFSGSWQPGGLFAPRGTEETALAFGQTVGAKGLKTETIKVETLDRDAAQVTLRQTLEGYPLSGFSLTVTVRSGAVTQARGQWVIEKISAYENLRLCDPLDALLKTASALSCDQLTVEDIALCYYFTRAGRYNLLYPAWEIQTDQQTAYFNAFSGELMQ